MTNCPVKGLRLPGTDDPKPTLSHTPVLKRNEPGDSLKGKHRGPLIFHVSFLASLEPAIANSLPESWSLSCLPSNPNPKKRLKLKPRNASEPKGPVFSPASVCPPPGPWRPPPRKRRPPVETTVETPFFGWHLRGNDQTPGSLNGGAKWISQPSTVAPMSYFKGSLRVSGHVSSHKGSLRVQIY